MYNDLKTVIKTLIQLLLIFQLQYPGTLQGLSICLCVCRPRAFFYRKNYEQISRLPAVYGDAGSRLATP